MVSALPVSERLSTGESALERREVADRKSDPSNDLLFVALRLRCGLLGVRRTKVVPSRLPSAHLLDPTLVGLTGR